MLNVGHEYAGNYLIVIINVLVARIVPCQPMDISFYLVLGVKFTLPVDLREDVGGHERRADIQCSPKPIPLRESIRLST